MHSELINLFGLHIQSYGVCIAIGFILCYIFARKLALRTGRNPNEVDVIVFIAAGLGLVGARIVYVWQNWAVEFAQDPLSLFALWKGGLVYYGGMILAILGFAVYARIKRESFLSLGDFCAVFLPLGQAFGRIGCFFHGCCFGGICGDSPIGIVYPKGSPAFLHQVYSGDISQYALRSLPVWPTQFIEAAACLALAALLWWIYLRFAKRFPGICGAGYMLGYAVIRFIVEILRDDPRGEQILGMSFSQFISVGCFLFGLLILLKLFMEKKVWKH